MDHLTSTAKSEMPSTTMDTLLAKLSEQQVLLEKQKNEISGQDDKDSAFGKGESTTSSVLLTPVSESFNGEHDSDNNPDEDTIHLDASEMARLKKELDAAKNQIARQKQELDQTRVNKTNIDKVVSPTFEIDKHSSSTPPGRAKNSRQDNWRVNEDAQSDVSDAMSTGTYNPGNNWSPSSRVNLASAIPSAAYQQSSTNWGQPGARPWNHRVLGTALPAPMLPQPQHMQQQRTYSGPASPISGGDARSMNDYNQFQGGSGLRRTNTQGNRATSFYPQPRNNGWDMYAGGIGGVDGINLGMATNAAYQSVGMYPASMPYQPRPIGTPLSPTAEEFRTSQSSVNPWNAAVSHPNPYLVQDTEVLQPPSSPGQTYVSPMEPLNYRRLLDRTVTCNWKYIVDKIVCNNDQQASIFLQQKLKIGTVEHKYEIIEAIVAQAYPLMVNRFGNFLVQRCFEHGTPEQVIAIANAIRGNTLSLSMDAFGCHVVQKAFDAVPEDYKAIMVHELLRRIPETVIHRYACHVWQKLFELRWSDSPPQIMKYVNEALAGMWHDVALGETGSLVVQNIFENCLEEDKVGCP